MTSPTKWRHRQAEDEEELYGWDGTRRGNVASAKGEAGPLVGGKITDYYDFPFFFFLFSFIFFILGTKPLQPRYYM